MDSNLNVIRRAPTAKNCQRTSSYLTQKEIDRIKAGSVNMVEVFDYIQEKTYQFNPLDVVNALLPEVRDGYNGPYRCFDYGLLDSKSEANQPKQYMTQTEISKVMGVDTVRICELHRFNFLKPNGLAKDGKTLLYLTSDVLKCIEESRVQHWMKELRGK